MKRRQGCFEVRSESKCHIVEIANGNLYEVDRAKVLIGFLFLIAGVDKLQTTCIGRHQRLPHPSAITRLLGTTFNSSLVDMA